MATRLISKDNQRVFGGASTPSVVRGRSGLAWHFPILERIVGSGFYLFIALSLCAMAVAISGRLVIALGMIAIGVALAGLSIEKKVLRRWPMPPMLWFYSVCIIAGGVGPILLSDAVDRSLDGIPAMQVGFIIGTVAFTLGFAIARPKSGMYPDLLGKMKNDLAFRSSCIGAGLCALLFGSSSAIVGAISGVDDRGMAGEEAAFQVFGYWSYFAAFAKIGPIGFFFLPAIMEYARPQWKFVASICSLITIGLGLLSGSRFSALAPFVLMASGYMMFIERAKIKLQILAWFAIPSAVFLFVFLDFYRNTDTFRQEALSSPIKKARALTETREAEYENSVGQSFIIGERLIGVIDPLIYSSTPIVIPYAGFGDYAAIGWMYIPTYFVPNKPQAIDGKAIAEEYMSTILIRTSTGPSLPGDFYRRFGWPGIVVGMFVIGVSSGLLIRRLVIGIGAGSYLSFAFFLLLCGFVVTDANMTLLTLIWLLLYDVPKQALLLAVFFWIGRGSHGAILRG
jgi:oligosaccharide repeat unit polymerase